MPQLTTPQGVLMHYEDDYFGEPWARNDAEVVVLLHGIAESSAVWFPWILQLAGTYRVIRPDLPGFGQSLVPPSLPYQWGPAGFVPDLHRLFDHLGLKRFHLVGAKHGGSVVVEYAARYPEQIKTVTVIGGPVQVLGESSAETIRGVSAKIRAEGMRKWAEDTIRDKRLGSSVSSRTTPMVDGDDGQFGCARYRRHDRCDGLAPIFSPVSRASRRRSCSSPARGTKCTPSKISSVGPRQRPGTRLVALDSDAYHPAAMLPVECIAAVKSAPEAVTAMKDSCARAPCLLAATVFAYTVAAAHAQQKPADYPKRPIRIIVGVFPGGGVDVLSRAAAQMLTDQWGQTVIVDNQAGGGQQIIAMDLASQAAPDGYYRCLAHPARSCWLAP